MSPPVWAIWRWKCIWFLTGAVELLAVPSAPAIAVTVITPPLSVVSTMLPAIALAWTDPSRVEWTNTLYTDSVSSYTRCALRLSVAVKAFMAATRFSIVSNNVVPIVTVALPPATELLLSNSKTFTVFDPSQPVIVILSASAGCPVKATLPPS